MQLVILHLDDSLKSQKEFLVACDALDGFQLEMSEIGRRSRLWCSFSELTQLQAILEQTIRLHHSRPLLTFLGSGDFHHVSLVLLRRICEQLAEPLTVVHFDNHPDWVKFKRGVHCGSWINNILHLPMLEKVITLGVSSKDLTWPEWKGANLKALREGKIELFPHRHAPSIVFGHYGRGASYEQHKWRLHWRELALLSEDEILDLIETRISTKLIYLTIDKDVLDPQDCKTNWDQGCTRLSLIIKAIHRLGGKYRIIGADVVGDYSVPQYSGSAMTRLKKCAEVWIDQPRIGRDAEIAVSLNTKANIALLRAFQEASGCP